MFSYIYLFFAAFYGSSISAILPFHLCPPPPLSFSCTSPYPFTLHSTLIFICTNIFLACSSFLLFLFPAVPVLLFFCFFFRFGLVLLPNTLRKAFHVCCAYEFQIFKNVSIVSLAFVVQVHVCVSVCPPALVCACVCVGRPEAGTGEGRRRTPKC